MKYLRLIQIAMALPVLLLGSCLYIEEDYEITSFSINSLVERIEPINPPILTANNADRVTIRVFLNNRSDSSQSVLFKTSHGLFTQNGKKELTVKSSYRLGGAELENMAEAELQTGFETGTMIVTVSINGFSTDYPIPVVRKYPSGITVTPSKLGVAPAFDSEIQFDVHLLADIGTVTKGHEIFMKVSNEVGDEIGTFRAVQNKSDSSGKGHFIYTVAPDTAFVGPLTVEAGTYISELETTPLVKSIVIYSIK